MAASHRSACPGAALGRRLFCIQTLLRFALAPQMLGPVIAPFIGAALTQAFGWRSMMWFLTILSAAAQLAVLLTYRWGSSCTCKGVGGSHLGPETVFVVLQP